MGPDTWRSWSSWLSPGEVCKLLLARQREGAWDGVPHHPVWCTPRVWQIMLGAACLTGHQIPSDAAIFVVKISWHAELSQRQQLPLPGVPFCICSSSLASKPAAARFQMLYYPRSVSDTSSYRAPDAWEMQFPAESSWLLPFGAARRSACRGCGMQDLSSCAVACWHAKCRLTALQLSKPTAA